MEDKSKEIIQGTIREAFPEFFVQTSFTEIDEHPDEHPAADIDFLDSLENGTLAQEERERLLKHLAVCPHCRNELVALIQSGAIFEDSLNAESASRSEPDSPSVNRMKSPSFKKNRQFSPVSLLSAAVVLVAAMGVGGFVAVPRVTGYLNYQNGLETMRRFQPSMNESGESFQRRIVVSSHLVPVNDDITKALNPPSSPKKEETGESSFAEEEEVLAKAAASRAEDPELRIFYAQFLFYKCGKKNEAVEQLRLAAEHFPGDAAVLFSLGTALFQTADYEKAADIYGEILEQNPDDLDALLNKALCLSKKDEDQAILFLEEAKGRFSGDDLIKIETQIREYQQHKENKGDFSFGDDWEL